MHTITHGLKLEFKMAPGINLQLVFQAKRAIRPTNAVADVFYFTFWESGFPYTSSLVFLEVALKKWFRINDYYFLYFGRLINFVVSWPCLFVMVTIHATHLSRLLCGQFQNMSCMFPLRIIIFKLQNFRTKINE